MRKISPHEICHICGKTAGKREWDNKGIFTGKYLCIRHYNMNYRMRHKDDMDKTKKELRNCRNGQLDPHSNTGKGFIFEQIVCKTLGIRNCNIELDNWNSHTDIDKHEKYGYISAKGANVRLGEWSFSNIDAGIFDTLILICMSSDKNVERVYAIPVTEAKKRSSVCVRLNPSRGAWYEKYRIDESPFDRTYHNIKLEDCKVLRH